MKASNVFVVVCVCGYMIGCQPPAYYSLLTVPEEGNVRLEKVTGEDDAVWQKVTEEEDLLADRMPLRTFDVSRDGGRIAFVSDKTGPKSNVFVKELNGSKALLQRTFRDNVLQVSFSPDGKSLIFTDEIDGGINVSIVDANSGVVARQVTTGKRVTRSAVYAEDGKYVIFSQREGDLYLGSFYLWSYGLEDGKLFQFGRGTDAEIIPGTHKVAITRPIAEEGRMEVWIVDLQSGQEYSVLSSKDRSYCMPAVSPDGKRLLVVGVPKVDSKERMDLDRPENYDIFMVNIDGQNLRQMTYHYGHDIAPRWAPDGKSFFFLSQRGSAERKWNVWRMNVE